LTPSVPSLGVIPGEATDCFTFSMAQAVRNVSAVFGDLRHDGLLKRDVLLGTAVRTGVHVKLFRELFSRREARQSDEGWALRATSSYVRAASSLW
jgi:hypothetical protein